MDNLNNSQNTPANSTMQFFMTSEQYRIINELLPKGYSLQFASKPARSKSGSFTKNIATAAAAFNRQNDGQLRNSNGQFASSGKTVKQQKYGGGKLVSQDNFVMPSPTFQSMNSGMMNNNQYMNMKGNNFNNLMMPASPQMLHQNNQLQNNNQQQLSQQQQQQQSQQQQLQQQHPYHMNSQNSQQLQNNNAGMQNPQLMNQQSQNLQVQQQQQNQNLGQQQGNQQMSNEMQIQGQQNGNEYYQQQNQMCQQQQMMQQQQQQQMSQQQYMQMLQMQQQNMYDNNPIHMKPTGMSRKNAAVKPRKEKKVKQAEKLLKPKRKNEGIQAPKVSKKQQAAAAMMMSGGMIPEEQKKCLHILHSLQKHKSAIPFLRPVDPVKQGCADYLLVIRDPMDLSTIERNLKTHQYQSPTQFAADIRKIWNNSYLYNSRESQIYNMTLEMDKYFEKKYKEMETRVYGNSQAKHLPTIIKFFEQAMKGNKQNAAVSTPTPRSVSQPVKKAKNPPSKMDIPMTMQEKKNLGQNILQLPPECLRGVWEIVKSDSNQQYDDKILTFDIDALPVRKTRELEQYVKQNNSANSKRLSKKQAKVQEKAINAENKLIQQTFCQDDETAATHHETAIVQDHNYTDMTQSTIQHTQQYQAPMHPSQYPMDQMHNMQPIRQYSNQQNDYLHNNAQHDNNQMNQSDYQDDLNDLDSDSSQMSADSDSQN